MAGATLRWARRTPTRALAMAAAVAGLFAAGPAAARPLQVEDLLQREDLGQVQATPGGRWLLVEHRAPYASAARFDYQSLNRLFRTRLMVTDLRRPAPLHPLFEAEAGVGYQLGPASPDGERAVVYRLKAERWELGVVTLAIGEVRWLPFTPELPGPGRTVQWRDATHLLAIMRETGDQPYEIRWMRPQAALPDRWATTAAGGLSVTVMGSGERLGVRPRAPAKSIVEITATTGAARTLAHGDFTDLELAPSGVRLAALAAGDDIPMAGDRQVQGDYGVATRRIRLVLVDLARGSVTHPAPQADVLANFLSWSAAGDRLLAYVRTDGEPWSEGRLTVVDAPRGGTVALPRTIRPVIERRPEVIYGGWWDGDPIVFGRPAQGGRPDWYRLGARGPVRLTAALKAPPRTGLSITSTAMLASADGAAWRIGRDGTAVQLQPAFTPLPPRYEGVPPRPAFAPRSGAPLIGSFPSPAGRVLGALFAEGGVRDRIPLPGGADPLAYVVGQGAALDRLSGGGREDVEWAGAAGQAAPLLTINASYEAIDTPRAIAVPHRGPNGEALRSWVLLPAPSVGGGPPPLIVIPYPGASYRESPAAQVNRASPVDVTAALIGHGYAVLVPSLPVKRGGSGPADGLAEQVLAIVDAAAAQPDLADAFDPERLGLWGHSFGGYAVLTILTQTPRFRAAVAQAAVSDMVSQTGVFSVGRRVHADEGASTPWQTGWVESLQGGMLGPLWSQTDRYVRNSPVFGANRIATPLMLVHGDQDFMSLGQSEEMFSALYRQNKDAQLVTYWGEFHQYASPGTLRDLYGRIFDWFDTRLAGRAPTVAAKAGS